MSDPSRQTEYSILFPFESDQFDIVTAELRSPLLDSELIPSKSLRIEINTDPQLADDSGFLLDSFQIHSLHEFIGSLPFVRSTLERELPRDQEQWDPQGMSVRDDLWSAVQIQSLRLWSRREAISTKSLPGHAVISSFFELALDCEWDSEHIITASFCDGEFMDLDHS